MQNSGIKIALYKEYNLYKSKAQIYSKNNNPKIMQNPLCFLPYGSLGLLLYFINLAFMPLIQPLNFPINIIILYLHKTLILFLLYYSIRNFLLSNSLTTLISSLPLYPSSQFHPQFPYLRTNKSFLINYYKKYNNGTHSRYSKQNPPERQRKNQLLFANRGIQHRERKRKNLALGRSLQNELFHVGFCQYKHQRKLLRK